MTYSSSSGVGTARLSILSGIQIPPTNLEPTFAGHVRTLADWLADDLEASRTPV